MAAQPSVNSLPAALSDSALSFPPVFYRESMEQRNPSFINKKCKSSIQDDDTSTRGRLFILWAGNVSVLLQGGTADFASHVAVPFCAGPTLGHSRWASLAPALLPSGIERAGGTAT